MDQGENQILSRLVEETTKKMGCGVEDIGTKVKPSGLELAHKLYSLYEVGPVAGIGNIVEHIDRNRSNEGDFQNELVYGSSFLRIDTKELIQCIYTVQALREATGDETLQMRYFMDESSHTLREYIEAIAFDYELDPEEVNLVKAAFKTRLRKPDRFSHLREEDQFFNLPPSFYEAPTEDAIDQLPLPDVVKVKWKIALNESEGKSLGDWIVSKNRLIAQDFIESIGIDPNIINISSFGEFISQSADSGKTLHIEEMGRQVTESQKIQPVVRRVSNMDEDTMSQEYHQILESVAHKLQAMDHMSEGYKIAFSNAKRAYFQKLVETNETWTKEGIGSETESFGMLCLIGIRDEDRMLITSDFDLIWFDRANGNRRINVSREVRDHPESPFNAEPFTSYLEVCNEIRNRDLQGVRAEYPIQPSGLGYYEGLSVLSNGVSLISDDYEQAIGPTSMEVYTGLHGNLTGIATPKGLIGNRGNFNVPPDVGMLLMLSTEGRAEISKLISEMRRQLLNDEINWFTGASLTYDRANGRVDAKTDRIDRYISLRLLQLSERIQSNDKSIGINDPYEYALYMYNPQVLETLFKSKYWRGRTSAPTPADAITPINIGRSLNSIETGNDLYEYLNYLGLGQEAEALQELSQLESSELANYVRLNEQEQELTTPREKFLMEVNYVLSIISRFEIEIDETNLELIGRISNIFEHVKQQEDTYVPSEEELLEVRNIRNSLWSQRAKYEESLVEEEILSRASEDSEYKQVSGMISYLTQIGRGIAGIQSASKVSSAFNITNVGRALLAIRNGEVSEEEIFEISTELDQALSLSTQDDAEFMLTRLSTGKSIAVVLNALGINSMKHFAYRSGADLNRLPQLVADLEDLGIQPKDDSTVDELVALLKSTISTKEEFGFIGVKIESFNINDLKKIINIAGKRASYRRYVILNNLLGITQAESVTADLEKLSPSEIDKYMKEVSQAYRQLISSLAAKNIRNGYVEEINEEWARRNSDAIGEAKMRQIREVKTLQGESTSRLSEIYRQVACMQFEERYAAQWCRIVQQKVEPVYN